MTTIQKSKCIQILRLLIDLEARIDEYIKLYKDGEFDSLKPAIDVEMDKHFTRGNNSFLK
jgi:hypothetical protein